MGAAKQLSRALRNAMNDFMGVFKKKQKRSKRNEAPEMVKIHRSWKKGSSAAQNKPEKVKVIEQQKMRIPGLLMFKRIAAAFLLLINFVFSQFLLGSVGAGAQWTFFIFLGNSLVLVDYLWKTRKKE